MVTVTITNAQSKLPVHVRRFRKAVRMVLKDASIARAKIGVAVVDDSTISKFHAKYLDDPRPTDVLSFMLEKSPGYLEGEIVVSAETAQKSAKHYNWSDDDELLLYVIHGALHLVGYEDATPKKRAMMRKREKEYLARFGLKYIPDV